MAEKKLECFVISPIGSPGTAIRKEADWVLRKLIRPALADSYNVVRADEFTKGEIITNRVITSIQSADLLVAVMSGHNPNVFYELAVGHAYSKPVVQLIKDGEGIPFDVGPVGTIFYSHDDVVVWDAAIEQLKTAADATRLPEYRVSNPITMALGAAKASASPDSTEQMVAKLAAELAMTRSELADLRSVIAPRGYVNPLQLSTPLRSNPRRDAIIKKLGQEAADKSLGEILFEAKARKRERELGRSLTQEEAYDLAQQVGLSPPEPEENRD